MRTSGGAASPRAAILAAAISLLAGACATGGRPAKPVPGTAKASAGRPSAAPGAHRQAAARYLAIAIAGNRRLEIDFDGLSGRDRGDLGKARADLRDAAAAERLFDRRLLAIAFPPATEQVARTLFRVNESRAALTSEAAAAPTLAQAHAAQRLLAAANEPVERAVKIIRSQLGLPPPDTS